jgi:hypothetical protein
MKLLIGSGMSAAAFEAMTRDPAHHVRKTPHPSKARQVGTDTVPYPAGWTDQAARAA